MIKKRLLTAVRGYLTVDLTIHKGHMIIECEVVYPLGSTNVLRQAVSPVDYVICCLLSLHFGLITTSTIKKGGSYSREHECTLDVPH